MTIKDEMAILGYLMLIAENTSRIADALERQVPPVPYEVKPVMKDNTRLKEDAEDSKPRDDASLGVVSICCETCQFVNAPTHDRICCTTCRNLDNWEPRRIR